MRPSETTDNSGIYTDYSDLLTFYKKTSKQTPKGVSFKLNNNKSLLLQFVFPDTGKRQAKSCNVDFTYSGIEQALIKANKVADALKKFNVASDFWIWYDQEVLEINEIRNDLKTYRVIFSEIEDQYFKGRNKNTKRKRSRDIPSDVKSFNRQYNCIFKKFTELGIDLDSYPKWDDIKGVLFSWEQGSKQFTMAYPVLRKICKNRQNILSELDQIDPTQTDFKDLQSISPDEFYDWYDRNYRSIESIKNKQHKEAKKKWLWVAAMCVTYGLRPTEVAASLNLTEPVKIDGKMIPAINDPSNKDLLLVIGDFTYFGISIKTGNRVCRTMITDSKILEKLHIQEPDLPIYSPNTGSKAESICNGFDNRFSERMKSYQLPVTQKYAFRHLSNQLGEMYGIPQEIRSRSFGHSMTVNDTKYKKRKNISTTIDLLTKHSKHPLPLEVAKQQLETLGFDLDDPSVKAILKVIYQLDN